MKNTIKKVVKTTIKNLLKDCFFELSIKDSNKYKSIYENKKENILKTNLNPIVKKLRIESNNNNKKLWKVTLYPVKSDLLTSDLLNEYNNINKKDNLIKTSTIKQLYNLYNTLYNVLYNWEVKQDLFGFYKSYFKSKIDNDWLKIDLKKCLSFETAIHYFIMNILNDKVVTKKSIKKEYIVNLFIRFIQNDFNDFNDLIVDWQQVNNDLTSFINAKYIYDKLNDNWQLDKLQVLLKDKEKLHNEYKEVLINIKQWIINKKDKEKLHNEYIKKVTNVNNKINRIKNSLKDSYLMQ